MINWMAVDLCDPVIFKTKKVKYEDVMTDELHEQFDSVLRHSQGFEGFSLNTQPLLEQWFKAKEQFIRAFGDQLILNCGEVNFQLNEDIRKQYFVDFIYNFYELHRDKIHMDFIGFCTAQGAIGFYDNKVIQNTLAPSGEILPCGMKFLKAIKYYIEDEELLNLFQTKASMLIQETKIVGELCFSVHPLDFLSVSENQHNWRSCHALDGEYRSGNLNYMVDSSTIICYLKSKEDTKLPNFPSSIPWNNKKWRMLLFFSDSREAIFAGRQYPFFSRDALDIVLEKMRAEFTRLVNGGWSSWHDDVITDFNYKDGGYTRLGSIYYPIKRGIYEAYSLITDGEDTFHFNDLLKSSCYQPWYCYNLDSYCHEHFSIGKAAPCILCGQISIGVSDDMLCLNCELKHGHSEDEDLFGRCEYCDSRTLSDEMVEVYYNGEWQWVCPHCADEHFLRCRECGTYWLEHKIHENGLCPECAARVKE